MAPPSDLDGGDNSALRLARRTPRFSSLRPMMELLEAESDRRAPLPARAPPDETRSEHDEPLVASGHARPRPRSMSEDTCVDKPKKLSDTARALLTVAATRGDHLIRPPKLPIAAARQVVRSLLNAGQVEEVPARVEDAVTPGGACAPRHKVRARSDRRTRGVFADTGAHRGRGLGDYRTPMQAPR
jgi:hypothetical protein